jgi:hypothetical protein
METTNTTTQTIDTVATSPILPDQKVRRRTGKVAHLPAEVRDFINNRLDNGDTYAEVAAKLGAKGHPEITFDNVGSWARGAYCDYLREKQRNTVLREHSDKVLALAASLDEQGRAGYEKVSASLVAAKIIDAIQDFDAKRLHGELAKKPDLFFRAARAVNAQSMDLSRLRKVELDFQKYRDHVAEQKQKLERLLKPKKAEGLTKEQIAEIHEAMRLL